MSDVWKRCRGKVSLHAMHRSNQLPEVIDLDEYEPPADSSTRANPGRRPADSPQAIPHSRAARRRQHAGPSALQSRQRASAVIDLSEGEAAAGLPPLHRCRDHFQQGSRTAQGSASATAHAQALQQGSGTAQGSASAAGHAQARRGLQGLFDEEDGQASLRYATADTPFVGAASFVPKR